MSTNSFGLQNLSPSLPWLCFAFQNHSLGKTQVEAEEEEGLGSSLMGWKSYLDYNMPSGQRDAFFSEFFFFQNKKVE